MPERLYKDFCGTPIPSFFELVAIDRWMPKNLSAAHKLHSIGVWAVGVMAKDPYVDRVIEHDLMLNRLTSDCGFYAGAERDSFENGLRLGYKAFIDIVSRIRYERGACLSREEFFGSSDATVVGSEFALRAVKHVRTGSHAPYYPRADIEAREQYDALEAKAGNLRKSYDEQGGAAFDSYRRDICEAVQSVETYRPYQMSASNGVVYGFEHAKGMYLQAHIARSLEQLDTDMNDYIRPHARIDEDLAQYVPSLRLDEE